MNDWRHASLGFIPDARRLPEQRGIAGLRARIESLLGE
jgi:hypothetical protein